MRRSKTGLPLGSLPIGRPLPKAESPQSAFDAVDRTQMREATLRVPHDNAHAFAELRAALEAAERRRNQEAAEALAQRRRQIIQRVKDRVVGPWAFPRPTVPAEMKARVLAEIERELSARAVQELPEWKLVALAEGIRDQHYRAVIQAQDEAKHREEQRRREEQQAKTSAEAALQSKLAQQAAEQERTRQQKDERASQLIDYGSDLARDALRNVDDLDPRERRRILRRVVQELDEDLTGNESGRAVEARVDGILDEELGEPEDDDEVDGYDEDEEDHDDAEGDDDWDDEGDDEA